MRKTPYDRNCSRTAVLHFSLNALRILWKNMPKRCFKRSANLRYAASRQITAIQTSLYTTGQPFGSQHRKRGRETGHRNLPGVQIESTTSECHPLLWNASGWPFHASEELWSSKVNFSTARLKMLLVPDVFSSAIQQNLPHSASRLSVDPKSLTYQQLCRFGLWLHVESPCMTRHFMDEENAVPCLAYQRHVHNREFGVHRCSKSSFPSVIDGMGVFIIVSLKNKDKHHGKNPEACTYPGQHFSAIS